MAKEKVTIRIFCKGRTWEYNYDYDLSRDLTYEALETWYTDECDTLFGLSGQYAPVDVHVYIDGQETHHLRICYQEYLWHVFFAEGGEPWHGRFSHFTLSLCEMRYRHDQKQLKAA